MERINRQRAGLRDQLRDAEGIALTAKERRKALDDAKTTLRKMAGALPKLTQAERREIVALFLAPGSVTFEGRVIRLLAVPPVAATATSRAAVGASIALVDRVA